MDKQALYNKRGRKTNTKFDKKEYTIFTINYLLTNRLIYLQEREL